MNEKMESYFAAQSWFAKNSEIYSSSRQNALQIVGRKVTEVMKVQRFGIWMFTVSRDAIYEELTYLAKGKHSHGRVIQRADYPDYFKKIDEARALEILVTSHDNRLTSFANYYMIPDKISGLLDAPIYSDGEIIGIVCCETTYEDRHWDSADKSFASSCADLVGRIIEAEKRFAYENELKHRIDYLENDLRKKLEDLKEANLTLDMALESAQAAKWDWHIPTGKLNLNRTWFSRLGYEYDEIPQVLESFVSVLHPDDRKKTFEALDKHLRGEVPLYECRYRMITKSGEIQYCIDRGLVTKREPDGTPIFATGVNVNITPVIQLEQSLIHSQQQLKAMISSIPAPVAMFDKDFKYIAYSLSWAREWSKYNPVEIGKTLGIRDESRRKVWYEQMERALKGEILSSDESYVKITQDVSLWVKWVVQPWRIANGEIGGVIIMAENITQKKEAEMRITQSSKLSALGEMAGGIAHEINNPLSIIKGYIDLLKRHSSRKSLTEELMLQYIDKMDLTVGRISRIVNGMRRFSRESSLDEKIPYSLNKIIDETLDICLERINNNGIALNVEYLKGEPMVECRPVEISQVLLNLINNSFQAISTMDHPWIRIICKEDKNNYHIQIIDCGGGIPLNTRQKLFQPFFTTKDIGVGTGLGLSISRGIIEEHEGQLNYIDDQPNTTFEIILPKIKEKRV